MPNMEDAPDESGKLNTIVSRPLADAIDGPLATAMSVPCERGQRNCIDGMLAKKGWHALDARKMCASCACYWHLSCARNFALGVVR